MPGGVRMLVGPENADLSAAGGGWTQIEVPVRGDGVSGSHLFRAPATPEFYYLLDDPWIFSFSFFLSLQQ